MYRLRTVRLANVTGSVGDAATSAVSSMACAASSIGFGSAFLKLGFVPPYRLRVSIYFRNKIILKLLRKEIYQFKRTALTVHW